MAKKYLSDEQRAKVRVYQSQWERDHREKRSEQRRKRYWADPEKAREQANKQRSERYWADPEKARAGKRKRYWANAEKSRALGRARYWAAKAKKW